ncbi:PTS sugar transporter subunit IIC [Streptobacillus felis]|uniref:Permease IIC component n=1 Tax=Streptobacillus felis TaxID=1384509 RepID=A0A7Z0PGE1_9FUSO|nr:PTS transporter subunit EIIC [Streptobacillus felis]NYV28082.1 PTS sugar transporter subunit IIC [Streptobacillus felis]
MKKFMDWMEHKFVPMATKLSSQRHLVAIRDSFIAILPVTMVGSIAVLLNVLFRNIPNEYGFPAVAEFMSPLININGVVWFGSLAILSLVFVVALGYNIATGYKVNPLAGSLVAVASFILFLPQEARFMAEINGAMHEVSSWGFLNFNQYLGATGLFPAMVIGFFSTIIYSKLMIRKVTINLPDSVPPAVNKAFASILPGVIAIYASATLAYLVTTYTGQTLNDLIAKYIQAPLLGLSQGAFSVILLAFLIQLFWFFGLHGHNVLAPFIDGIYQPALLANAEHIAKGGTVETLPYLWTRGSFDAYLQMGGSGITIALIIAIFLFSKKEEHRAVAKLGLPMGIFNINEPMIFGMPIVLNPLYLIPFLSVSTICAIIAYVATVLGVVPPVFVQVPWVLPPGLYAFFATGGSISAALLSLFNVFVAFVIWTPFVIMANRIKEN